MPAYCRRKCGIFQIRLSLLLVKCINRSFSAVKQKLKPWKKCLRLPFSIHGLCSPSRKKHSLTILIGDKSIFFFSPENCWFSLCSSSFCFLHHFRKLQSGATPLKLIKGLAEKFSLVLLHLPVFYSPREREKLLGAALLVAVFSLMAFSRHFCKFSRARLSLASSPKSIKQKTICWPILFFL